MPNNNQFGTYDPYDNSMSLQEKIGGIIENVNKLEEKERKIEEKDEDD